MVRAGEEVPKTFGILQHSPKHSNISVKNKWNVRGKRDYHQICPEEESKSRGSFDWIICKYLKGLMGTDKYYKEYKVNINRHILSLDFHELFTYMYQSRSSEEFNIIDYIFDKRLKRDFNFTLLPPMVFELMQHYEYLKRKTFIHGNQKKKHSKTFQKLIEASKRLNLEKTDNITENEDFKFINKFWAENYYNLTSSDILDLLSTEFGTQRMIGEPCQRIESLFESGMLRTLKDLNVIDDPLEIGMDKDVYKNCLDEFAAKRKQKESSNFNDAAHAAMAVAINKIIGNNDDFDILDIYTGSPITLDILENQLDFKDVNKTLHRYTFVKCPVYITSNLFCNNELNNSPLSRDEFLESCIYSLIDLKRAGSNFDKLDIYSHPIDYCKNRTLHHMRFIDIFYFNEQFYRYLEESLKLTYFYYKIDSLTRMQQILGSVTDGNELMKVRLLSEYDRDNTPDDDKLIEFNEQIFNRSKKLYSYCIDYIKEYDYSKLTTEMELIYEQMISSP